MVFQPGHPYHPPGPASKAKKLPDDPLDLIETGLVKDMQSTDDKARHAAYVIYLRLQGQRKNKRTVLDPIIEQLVSWLYGQADSQSLAIREVIQVLTVGSDLATNVALDRGMTEDSQTSASLPISARISGTSDAR